VIAEIVAALRGHAKLRHAFELYNSMIQNVKEMYALATSALRGKVSVEDVRDKLYALDREVNEKERTIRRSLISHLSLRVGQDAPACLMLMSVVKDAERLGDYCKNLFEVAEMFGKPLARGRYMTPLFEISGKLEALLAKTGEAFIRSNRDSGISHRACWSALSRSTSKDLPCTGKRRSSTSRTVWTESSGPVSGLAVARLGSTPRGGGSCFLHPLLHRDALG